MASICSETCKEGKCVDSKEEVFLPLLDKNGTQTEGNISKNNGMLHMAEEVCTKHNITAK